MDTTVESRVPTEWNSIKEDPRRRQRRLLIIARQLLLQVNKRRDT
jgi:hypothetical protein